MRTGLPVQAAQDFIQPFQIEGAGNEVRGRLVRLSHVAENVLSQHAYPPPVAILLAETMAVAAALAAALKYEGMFTLQTSSDGPVSMLVVDLSSNGAMRGYAQFDSDRLAKEVGESNTRPSLPRIMGKGHLAFTVDQGSYTDRYQGIVELEGATLAECIQHYFRQSEQLQATLKIAASHTPSGWRAGALMLQRMPSAGIGEIDRENAEDAWRRALALMASCRDQELLSDSLSAEELLYRLFHEDGVRVFSPQGVVARCRCSRERVVTMLKALSPEELEDLVVDGLVQVTCEFCSSRYDFTMADIAAAISEAAEQKFQ